MNARHTCPDTAHGPSIALAQEFVASWWQIVDVLRAAAAHRDEPPANAEADRMLARYRSAKDRLLVIRSIATGSGGEDGILLDLHSLLADTVFDDPDWRTTRPWVTLDLYPRPGWAGCSDDDWLRAANTHPISTILGDEILEDGYLNADQALIRWYLPTVLADLAHPFRGPGEPAQRQLSRMLEAIVDEFVLPHIRDSWQATFADGSALIERTGRSAPGDPDLP